MPPRNDDITLEDVRIGFRNFSGKPDKYNHAGDRNFVIFLTDAMAQVLDQSGWNVKLLKARDEDEGAQDQPYVQVAVSYKNKPPRIILITHRGRNPVDEDTVGMLDFVEIENVDLTLSPYKWEVNGNTGVKAYLKTMYIKIVEDPLDIKYSEPDLDDGVAD